MVIVNASYYLALFGAEEGNYRYILGWIIGGHQLLLSGYNWTFIPIVMDTEHFCADQSGEYIRD